MLKTIPSMVPTLYKSQMQSYACDLSTRSDAILAALGNVNQPRASGALGLAGLEQIQPLYESSKSYMCCDVPGLAAKMWIILTVLGWLGLALGIAGLVVLYQLDQAHGSGACCSCVCLRPARLPTAGKPIDMEEMPVTAVRSQHYQIQNQELRQLYINGNEPVVEVRVSRGNGGAEIDGVRSWLDLRPPVQEMTSHSSGRLVRQQDASSQSLPAVTN